MLTSLLKNTARSLDRVRHLAAFLDGQRCGLLQVDVFAGQRRFHRHLCVPVVGRADGDRIDALVLEYLAVVTTGFDICVLPCPELLRVRLLEDAFRVSRPDGIQIANGYKPRHIAIPENAGEFGDSGDAAAADLRHLDQVIRRAFAEDAGRDDGGKAYGRPPQ